MCSLFVYECGYVARTKLCSFLQPQPEFKSYPVEPVGPLACTGDGSYIVGGGVSGRIYIWEVISRSVFRKYSSDHYLIYFRNSLFVIVKVNGR